MNQQSRKEVVRVRITALDYVMLDWLHENNRVLGRPYPVPIRNMNGEIVGAGDSEIVFPALEGGEMKFKMKARDATQADYDYWLNVYEAVGMTFTDEQLRQTGHGWENKVVNRAPPGDVEGT